MHTLTVFYDGACHLCSREIDQYRRKDVRGQIEFIDIAAKGFDAHAWRVDPVRVNQVMHARDKTGETFTEVAAFAAIWRALGWQRLAGVALSPYVLPFLTLAYRLFARGIRPYLPKRKVDQCSETACAARLGAK